MERAKRVYTTIDEYIDGFPEALQKTLQELRAVIRAAAPGATEKIAYQMPTFFLRKNLVHFAVFKNHIGFYPAPSGIEAFAAELAPYERSKGAIRFPLDRPLPLDLIRRMVEYRAAENLKK